MSACDITDLSHTTFDHKQIIMYDIKDLFD